MSDEPKVIDYGPKNGGKEGFFQLEDFITDTRRDAQQWMTYARKVPNEETLTFGSEMARRLSAFAEIAQTVFEDDSPENLAKIEAARLDFMPIWTWSELGQVAYGFLERGQVEEARAAVATAI